MVVLFEVFFHRFNRLHRLLTYQCKVMMTKRIFTSKPKIIITVGVLFPFVLLAHIFFCSVCSVIRPIL